jgi:putative transposase
VIVEMRTLAQAARVATATGGAQLAGAPGRDGAPRLSRRVDVGADFGAHRAAVEAVSVLFKLFDDTGGRLVEVPSGWMVTAAKFEVEWPAEPAPLRPGAVAFRGAAVRVQLGSGPGEVRPGRQSR